MLADERLQAILYKINKEGAVFVGALSTEFGVSMPTIRRDIDELEKRRSLKKIHGGATLFTEELPFGERNIRNHKEKAIIAETAARLIEENDTIFLDAGTTVYQMINYIKDIKNLVVLTNSLKTATSLMNYPNIVTILIGGSVKPSSYATVGIEAINNIKRYKVKKLFIGADGLDDVCFTVQDINEALTKKAMIEISAEKYLLVDSSKLGNPTFVEVTGLDQLDAVITEKGISKTRP